MVAVSLTHYSGVSIPNTPLFDVRPDRGAAFGCLQKVLRLRGGAARSLPFHFPFIPQGMDLRLDLGVCQSYWPEWDGGFTGAGHVQR